MLAGLACDHRDGFFKHPGARNAEQQQRRDGFEHGAGVGSVDSAMGRNGVLSTRRGGHQCGEVVAQHLGGDIVLHGQEAQSGDMLQIQVVLEAFESLFDAPAGVVELGEVGGREALGIQQTGHEDARSAIGRTVPDQAHGYRFRRAPEVAHIGGTGWRQAHDLLIQRRFPEGLHGGEAALTGIDAKAKLEAPLLQHGEQPARGVAPIEQQQVARGEAVHLFEQGLSLAGADAVEGGGEHEVGIGQVAAQQECLAACRTRHVAGTQAKAQIGAVDGDPAQATPTRDAAGLLDAFDQLRIQGRQGGPTQLGSGLSKGLSRDMPDEGGLLLKVGEEPIEFGLYALGEAADQGCDQCRQWQFAASSKGVGMIGVTGDVEECIAVEELAEGGEDA